jgi:hypothetical protein
VIGDAAGVPYNEAVIGCSSINPLNRLRKYLELDEGIAEYISRMCISVDK